MKVPNRCIGSRLDTNDVRHYCKRSIDLKEGEAKNARLCRKCFRVVRHPDGPDAKMFLLHPVLFDAKSMHHHFTGYEPEVVEQAKAERERRNREHFGVNNLNIATVKADRYE